MTSEKTHCSLADLVTDLNSLLLQCVSQLSVVEHSVLNWLHDDGQIATFPLVDFQRMDFIRQLQEDVIAVLTQLRTTSADTVFLPASACQEIVNSAKLEFTKTHLKSCFSNGPSNDTKPEVHSSEFEAF